MIWCAQHCTWVFYELQQSLTDHIVFTIQKSIKYTHIAPQRKELSVNRNQQCVVQSKPQKHTVNFYIVIVLFNSIIMLLLSFCNFEPKCDPCHMLQNAPKFAHT